MPPAPTTSSRRPPVLRPQNGGTGPPGNPSSSANVATQDTFAPTTGIRTPSLPPVRGDHPPLQAPNMDVVDGAANIALLTQGAFAHAAATNAQAPYHSMYPYGPAPTLYTMATPPTPATPTMWNQGLPMQQPLATPYFTPPPQPFTYSSIYPPLPTPPTWNVNDPRSSGQDAFNNINTNNNAIEPYLPPPLPPAMGTPVVPGGLMSPQQHQYLHQQHQQQQSLRQYYSNPHPLDPNPLRHYSHARPMSQGIRPRPLTGSQHHLPPADVPRTPSQQQHLLDPHMAGHVEHDAGHEHSGFPPFGGHLG